ncbi:Ribbon-helix-helix domain [Moraxella caprae]|uniref:Ribbon-helix-helix domain n=1 Tax=Moraxella caprae TaxID=90240 RepID=A0A378QD45_9GAMM|nr:ribbon-helix-helix domain-containing protein [Moraxella caprae]STY98631.1 Ribbon-helix-helix domain [Moraxella caprae]STZ01581.1 Ribbon-helix-helix domain [Moraxella caprae]
MNTPLKDYESINATIPPELNKRLTALAKDTARPKSFYIRQAIERYLDDLENQYKPHTVENKS